MYRSSPRKRPEGSGYRNTDRSRDLTPTQIDAWSGGGENLVRWIKEELVVWINHSYRTQPFRVLAGLSLGGLFSALAFISEPDLFNAYLLVSPSLYWDHQILVKRARTLFESCSSFNSVLFLTYDSEFLIDHPGIGQLVKPVREFAGILSEMGATKGLTYRLEPLEQESHRSVAHKGFYQGLEWVFSLPRVKQQTKH
jgi:predicted alpha/beta superfamily hydrolase